jgi:hypothetical protein
VSDGPVKRHICDRLSAGKGIVHYYVGLGKNSLHFHGILAARYEPFAKDLQTAFAQRGAEVADQDKSQRIANAVREKLSAPGRARQIDGGAHQDRSF